MNPRKKQVVVTGDPICDCDFYLGERATADSSSARGFRAPEPVHGGALLLRDLVAKVLETKPEFEVVFGLATRLAKLPSHYRAYSLWEPQVANPSEKELSKQVKIWRAVVPSLGYGPEQKPADLADALGKRVEGLRPEVLVIDDAGLDFRSGQARDRWPFDSEACPTVLKLSGPIGDNALWEELTANRAERLIVVVPADQIRRSEIRLSLGLSWEATVEDLHAELEANPLLSPLLRARHVIVTFGCDGAFWMDVRPTTGDRKSMLVFDGAGAEGDWAARQGKGAAYGYLSCVTAAVVAELCKDAERPDLAAALRAGLSAGRELLRTGHGHVMVKQTIDGVEKDVVNPSPCFPLAEIARCIREPHSGDKFVDAPLPSTERLLRRGKWMMLDEWQIRARDRERTRPYWQAAFAAAALGPDALERFPVARFGELLTVDRDEIESLRILRRLISDYDCHASRDARPLNVGVFGPPGAGKSFGVKEISKAVLGEGDRFLTFNLSQFSDSAALVGALHQVRDKVLAGITPVVFWDEFDSEHYRWLQYLLAPMNDGAFQDGQITHPVGKCVFIFAGATSSDYDSFGPPNPETLTDSERASLSAAIPGMAERWADFVLKKGPDFKSRLVAFLNVLGPNPRRVAFLGSDGRRRSKPDPDDLCWPIRRAFFIRQKFKLKDGQHLDMDEGLLRALLEVPTFKAGARSLEWLCFQLRDQAKKGPVKRSHLPGRHVLDMHVDSHTFWKLCESDLEFMSDAQVLARGFHDDWRHNPATDPGNPNNKDWNQLEDATRRSNVKQALRISTNLAAVDLSVEKGAAPAGAEADVKKVIDEHIELLAEAEHNGWMVERMIAGWRYAKERNDKKKLHDLLLPYAQLSEAQKEKDRRPIRGYEPDATRRAAGELPVPGYVERLKPFGYRIVPLSPEH